LRIEAIGEELFRALPLLRVGVDTPEMDDDLLICFHFKVSNIGWLGQVISRRDGSRGIGSKSFIEGIRKVVHVSESLVNKGLIKVNFPVDRRVFLEMGFNDDHLDVPKQLLVHLRVPDNVVHHVADCGLCGLRRRDEEVDHLVNDQQFVFGLREVVIPQQMVEEVIFADH